MLNDRKKEILQAIIEEYIQTAEPVSSNAIVQKYGLNYSSATVRNEMSDLEKEGYLDKPHTSAGRVPSAKGYRFYVDELLKDDNISLEEVIYLQSKLQTKVNQMEDLTKITTNTLSEITHYPTVSIGPNKHDQIIEDIKFVLLGTRTMMAIILTDSGIIKETIIKFDEDVTEEQVNSLTYMFNNKLKGMSLDSIDIPMEEYILSQMSSSINVIKPIINEIKKVIDEKGTLYYEGTNKAFELPEFKSLDLAKNFVNILDEEDLMIDTLNSGEADDINVYIGDENSNDEFKDFSIITFNHKVHGKSLGTIGIIGPKRMDYSKVISVLKYINRKMNEGRPFRRWKKLTVLVILKQHMY